MPGHSYQGAKPGNRKRANKKNKSGLGRSLVNHKTKAAENLSVSERYSTDLGESNNLKSVTHEQPLEEFLNTAELADTDFTTERSQAIKIVSTPGYNGGVQNGLFGVTVEDDKDLLQLHEQNKDRLTIPRRPKWTVDMTPHELDRLEKDQFLQWRRGLAELQDDEDFLLTPYERNIGIWRQLWRVVERSDLVIQIVDSRNPLFFYSTDLFKYVKEVCANDSKKRTTMLLVNKSDLLDDEQRKAWAKYFKSLGIQFAFFSAKKSSDEIERLKVQEENGEEKKEDQQESQNEDAQVPEAQKEAHEQTALTSGSGSQDDEDIRILSVDQLEQLFIESSPKRDQRDSVQKPLEIGLVGYPNVGKSSTINALIGAKKVSVSATPGKTKHFQTIILSPEITLCDCPGLVFPNFATNSSELVCNGVLPIDQLREFHSSVELITQRIPKFFLEAVYGISIPIRPMDEGGSGIPTAEEFLRAYARARGYMKAGANGQADESRAARLVLKDYVNAKLLYSHPPPDYPYDGAEYNKNVYTMRGLPESRQQQILSAIVKSRTTTGENDLIGETPIMTTTGLSIDEVDLASEIEKLTFSQHNPNATLKPLGPAKKADSRSSKGRRRAKGAAFSHDDFTEGDALDAAFFANGGGHAHSNVPFHQRQLNTQGKKHFKGKKAV